MTPHDLRRVHHDVFLAKIDTTIMAGSLTKAAKANLNRHAGWLGVDATDMDEMIKAARKRVKLNQKAFRDSLSGQSICFIGRGLHPTNIRQALCEKNGIVFQSTVNASTSMLVKGNDMATSASVTAAETNSLPTMLEADFWRQLGE